MKFGFRLIRKVWKFGFWNFGVDRRLEVWKFGSLDFWENRKFGSLEVWSLEVWKFRSLEIGIGVTDSPSLGARSEGERGARHEEG